MAMLVPRARLRRLSVGLCAVGVVAMPLGAQSGRVRAISGTAVDTTGRPLPNVEVRIISLGRVARSDSVGHFGFADITDRTVDLTARRLGYQLQMRRISLVNGEGDNLKLVMIAEPLLLTQVEVEATESHPFFSEFQARRSRGLGSFLTEKDFKSRNSSYPSDVLRTLPGVRLVRSASGGFGVRLIGTVQSGRRGGECVPLIWVDGQAVPGMEIDEIRSQDIYGLEIYRQSTTPPQFVKPGFTHCGTVVVWTQRRR